LKAGEIRLFEFSEEEREEAKAKLEAKRRRDRESYQRNIENHRARDRERYSRKKIVST
jgi:hypothetical protein